MANQDRRAESPLVDHLVEIGHVVTRAICPVVGPLALAMPALIECEHMKIHAECGRDKIPPMRVRGTAMNEQDRTLTVAAVIKAVKRETVGFETMLFHGTILLVVPAHDLKLCEIESG